MTGLLILIWMTTFGTGFIEGKWPGGGVVLGALSGLLWGALVKTLLLGGLL